MPHSEVLSVLEDTDIFIYTPYINGAGKFGFEALLSGAIVLTGYDENYLKLPKNSPIINITSINILEKLDFYIKNKELRIDLAKKGIAWAKKYSNQEWICNTIINNLENNIAPDHFPKFFTEHATFTSKWDTKDAIKVANKWTKYVKESEWYDKYIDSNTREGLSF
jgi:hypothetical protein